jgi:hypothetical protein
MLRSDVSGTIRLLLWGACALIGVLAGLLVWLGNPANMGLCGACFLRDTAGAFNLFSGDGPRIFRPEVVGLILGAFLLAVGRRKFEGRAGSYAGARFFLGIWMGIGALVFLGCPFRMLQRLGGGDLNAVVGLGGFLVGVGVGMLFERLGYSAGKTSVVAMPVGLPAIVFAAGALVMFLTMNIPAGPKPGETGGLPHAFWGWSLGLALLAGALLSLTGFCAVSAARQVFVGPRRMLIGAVLLIAGFGVFAAATGKFKLGFDSQPVAHSDHVWNALSMVLVGLTGILAGGCPVRLIVLSGEGNGDALVTAAGILVGGASAHALGLASTAAGPTGNGQVAVRIGLGLCVLYALAVALTQRGREASHTAGV